MFSFLKVLVRSILNPKLFLYVRKCEKYFYNIEQSKCWVLPISSGKKRNISNISYHLNINNVILNYQPIRPEFQIDQYFDLKLCFQRSA